MKRGERDNRSGWVIISKSAKKNQGFWHEKVSQDKSRKKERNIDLERKREITIKHE